MYFLDSKDSNLVKLYNLRVNESKKDELLKILAKTLDNSSSGANHYALETGFYEDGINTRSMGNLSHKPVFIRTMQIPRRGEKLNIRLKIKNRIQEKMILQREYKQFGYPFTSEFIIGVLSSEENFSQEELIQALNLDDFSVAFINYLRSVYICIPNSYRLSKVIEKSCVDKENFLFICDFLSKDSDAFDKYINEFPDIKLFMQAFACMDFIESDENPIEIDKTLSLLKRTESWPFKEPYKNFYMGVLCKNARINNAKENDRIVKTLKLVPNFKTKNEQ